MVQLVLIRGLPGSGKSTLAKKEYYDYHWFEADMFFMNDQEYVFNRDKLSEAHQWCQNAVKRSLQNGHKAVVSNTFVKRWEMEPYLKMAKEFNVDVTVITTNGNFTNVHGVPSEIIDRMRLSWEDFDLKEAMASL